ncbi:MAG TPA: response regulator [Polyangiaceae bacterium]|jgi:CheY-like chemotaxis protein|nr:response regulator [Polyangiaceae bacterium]
MASPGYILIVEDDDDIREALTQILELEGYVVREAANGREALEISAREPVPSLILLDLMMPVMDGWQFRSEQLKDPTLSKIPVVVISADASVHEKVASFGAASVLPKPISLDRLLRAVESLYPLPRQPTT